MKIASKHVVILFFSLISVFYISTSVAQNNSRLESYTYLGEFSKEKAKFAMAKLPPLDTLEYKYSLNLYKIIYKTPLPNGDMTSASGLVAMPISPTQKVSIVSYNHGTRLERDDVPSRNNKRNYPFPAVFGNSGGYMVVMPDYLGYGDNPISLHPYVQSDSLASTSIDMLIAAKELAQRLNYPINDKLFITGYSEGGFTTMVMYEEMLKHYKDIPITAVAPGSAPYDWQVTMPPCIDHPGPRNSVYLGLFFYSMQTYFHYWEGMDVIFKKPYDTLIPTLYDGHHSLEEILEALPQDPRQMMQASFVDSILDGTDAHTKELIKNFNHYDFKSTSPLLLIGTKGDQDVPYHGAEIAYDHLSHLSDKVYIKSVSDKLDHIEAATYIMKEQLEFFKKFDN